jgi:hypothetical protein
LYLWQWFPLFRRTRLKTCISLLSNSTAMAEFIVVDDSSPDIRYLGAWWGANDPNDVSSYNHTAHLTRNVGDTVNFTFSGEYIHFVAIYFFSYLNKERALEYSAPMAPTARNPHMCWTTHHLSCSLHRTQPQNYTDSYSTSRQLYKMANIP